MPPSPFSVSIEAQSCCGVQNGRAQDQAELLRFGLNFIFSSCRACLRAGGGEEEDREEGCPPAGLSVADVEELSYVRIASLFLCVRLMS